MTIIETIWMTALSVAVVYAGLNIWVAWLNICEDWQSVVGAIVVQWGALLSMALLLSVILGG